MIPLDSKHTTELVAVSASERLFKALQDLIEENHQLRAVIAAMSAPKPDWNKGVPPLWPTRGLQAGDAVEVLGVSQFNGETSEPAFVESVKEGHSFIARFKNPRPNNQTADGTTHIVLAIADKNRSWR